MMFKKKRLYFSYYDCKKRHVRDYLSDELPFSMSCVHLKCAELYGEEEVCFVRECAVRSVLLAELEQQLLACGTLMPCDKLPYVAGMLDGYLKVTYQTKGGT